MNTNRVGADGQQTLVRPDGRSITGCHSRRVWCGWFSPAGRLQDTDSRSLHLQTDERAPGCNVAPDTRLCLLGAKTLCCLHSLEYWSLIGRWASSDDVRTRLVCSCSVMYDWLEVQLSSHRRVYYDPVNRIWRWVRFWFMKYCTVVSTNHV